MSSEEIRKKFLEFFKKRGHKIIPSASLVPEKDTTTLFTGSGMQPLINYLLGEPHPLGKRLVNSQRSFRVEDIEEVGDNRHTTFFEMLGNWSLGDYFKDEQLPWFFEFITDVLKLDPKKIYITVFAGDEENGIPKDEKSALIWKKLFRGKGIEAKDVFLGTVERGSEVGMQGGRIFYYGAKNWWSRTGSPATMPQREPGGPDSEVFYEFAGFPHNERYGKYCHPNCDCGHFMEIGNSVFIEYRKRQDGKFEKLPQQNVDFGGGLERMVAASNNDPDIFNIDVFQKLAEKFKKLVITLNTQDQIRRSRIILDHIRASVYLIADGVEPSNKDRGYVLRRLLRRAIYHSVSLAGGAATIPLDQHTPLSWNDRTSQLIHDIIDRTIEYAPEDVRNSLLARKEYVHSEFIKEEGKFLDLLKSSTELHKVIEVTQKEKKEKISGDVAFMLYSTYGIPIDYIRDEASKYGLSIDEVLFEKNLKAHQEISRAGAVKKFGGHGLILNTGELKAGDEAELKKVTRLHTATHLLHQALRQVLGDSVHQMGSDITTERTRFDFSFNRKMTPEEIKKVEDLANEQVKKDWPVHFKEMAKEEAEKTGALHFFKEKYPEKVKVYYIGKDLNSAWSKEFCGGPHVTHTGEIGKIRILKEEAVGAGMRRIRAKVD